MPFLGLFSKRDKHRAPDSATDPSTSTASDFDQADPDYVLRSAASAPPRSIYAGPPGASSSKLKLGLKSKKPLASRTDTNLLSPPTPNFSGARSESDHDLLTPPRRSAVFAAYDDPMSARSTRSLPAQPTAHSRANSKEFIDLKSDTASPPVPPKHNKGFFAWAHRERKKSKPPPPPTLDPIAPLPSISTDTESFNLRSFRHVRPDSPSDSASSILPPVRPRPREGSFTSDSSQRISVAAFREAHARRSAANSPVPSFSHDALSPGSPAGLRPPSSFVNRSSARSPGGAKSNDSSSSDTEDSEDDGDSEASSTLKPRRNRTITQRSAKSPISPGQKSISELGHRTARPSPTPSPRMAASASANMSFVAPGPRKDSELYTRPRASASTSALQPDPAARRASLLASQQSPPQRPTIQTQGQLADCAPSTSTAKPVPQKPRSVRRPSSSSSSSSSSSDSDDAPLATLVGPRRPGSAASSAQSSTRPRAQSRAPSKPLIDISTIAPSPPLLSQADRPPVPAKDSPVDDRKSLMSWREKEKPSSPPPTTPTHAAKPSLNDRLARLAKGAQSPSTDTSSDASKEEEKELPRGRKVPTRSQTQPPEVTLSSARANASPSPSPSPAPPRKPNGRSMSSPNATFEDVKQADANTMPDAAPIMPTPIRTRTPPPAFAVTSRPASQFSLLSIGGQQHQPQQDRHWQSNPRASEETVRTNRTRASTLIADGDLARDKGFTGGGLLAAAAAGSSSSLSGASAQSTGSGAVPARTSRQRASTVIASSPAPSHPATPPQGSPSDAWSRSRSNVRGIAQPDTPPQDLPPPRLVTRSSNSDTLSIASSASPPTRPTPILKSAMKSSPQPSPIAETNGPFPRPRTSSLAAFSSFPTPPKPFAASNSGFGLRGNSPASSTGDSSSGRTPITPVDGSDISATTPSVVSAQRRGHRKSASVTFDEPERGRPGARERDAEKVEGSDPEERRRRERRRSEAKAAIELGKIVNGRGPIATDDDEERTGMENMGPRMSMAMFNPMMGPATAGSPVNVTPPTPMGFGTPQTPTGMFNPAAAGAGGQFMFPMVPPNADPAFLVAHQQAMLAAKQAFQMAVAQQALAAANEEWERGSTATSAFGGFGGMGGGMFPGGMNMNMNMNMAAMGGMGMGLGVGGPWQNAMMFPSSQSMYAGSVIGGSELGVNTTGRSGGGWGSRSAYGEPSGYSGSPGERASMAFRNSQFLGGGYGSGARSEIGGPTSARGGGGGAAGQRSRTRTSPSDGPLPAQHAKSRGGPPPSSWNTRTNRPA
ncbi:hypothetical protein C8Q77DRAFT_119728 [Trametes polyzona]|nr:hypothetical protein C8Q77DRAFT_119728 [Trametes polyzona]